MILFVIFQTSVAAELKKRQYYRLERNRINGKMCIEFDSLWYSPYKHGRRHFDGTLFQDEYSLKNVTLYAKLLTSSTSVKS